MAAVAGKEAQDKCDAPKSESNLHRDRILKEWKSRPADEKKRLIDARCEKYKLVRCDAAHPLVVVVRQMVPDVASASGSTPPRWIARTSVHNLVGEVEYEQNSLHHKGVFMLVNATKTDWLAKWTVEYDGKIGPQITLNMKSGESYVLGEHMGGMSCGICGCGPWPNEKIPTELKITNCVSERDMELMLEAELTIGFKRALANAATLVAWCLDMTPDETDMMEYCLATLACTMRHAFSQEVPEKKESH